MVKLMIQLWLLEKNISQVSYISTGLDTSISTGLDTSISTGLDASGTVQEPSFGTAQKPYPFH